MALALFVAGAAHYFAPEAVRAVEQSEEFLAALRSRGLNELALDYLVRMEASPLADDEFKRRIPYHRGVTLMDLSRQTVDADARAEFLVLARAELDKFAGANPDSVAGAEANVQLAGVQVEQAKQFTARAEQFPTESLYDQEREEQYRQARELLDQARTLFQAADAAYSAELKKLSDEAGVAEDEPAPAADEEKKAAPDPRQELRGRLAQVRVLAAQAQFDKAQTYPPDSATHRQLNEESAKELSALYEAYSRWLVGLYAHLYEGRCYQALGDYQRALGCYEQLINQPNVHPAFRKLIAAAIRYQAECFLDREEYDAAITNCAAWLKQSAEGELQQPEWLAVRFHLAEAMERKAEAERDGSQAKRRLKAQAAEAYNMVAAVPNEFQLAARTAADALEPRQRNAADEPDDFKAAYEAGKKAIASANAARIAMPAAEQNNPATAADLRRQFQTSADNARHYFRLATILVDDDTDLAQLNEVRYFLCWLHWDNQDYFQAAILGEFLARRYPDHPAAAASAKLAMAAYERLYQTALVADAEAAAQADATDFEARKMAEVAEFITRRWPDSPDADAAFSLLITYAIRNNQIERAEQMLAEASSQHRAQLELQLGNAMWGHYLEQANLAPAERTDPAALDSLRKTAIGHLQTGFDKARKARSIDESTATGALFLAQALLADGKHQEAIDLLEQEEVGPLTLVKNSDPAAGRPGFAVETYKAALRAYVTASPPQAERALEMMQALEATAESNGDAESDDLLQIYLGLGMSLRQQIDELRAAGRDAEANQVTEAFVKFLDQLTARPGGSWASRQWIAQVYYTLGEQAMAGAAGADQTRRYFNKAAASYRQLLDSAKSGSSPPPSAEAALLAQKQLGDCLRQAGEYAQALGLYSAVLKEKESWLAVQFAAAMAYQERGQAEGSQWLERAIYGGYQLKSTGKNRIWGWLKLAQVADRAARTDPKYSDMFFETRLNAARCRFLIGLQTEGPARAQHFATAKQNIRSMEQLFPDFGGPRWKQEFDELSKQIRRAADSESTQ